MENNILNKELFEKRQKIYNQILLGEKLNKKDFAFWLREHLTVAEKEMKKLLKSIGVRFYTQYIIDPFIVDFCYRKYMLIIEFDGPYHNKEYDRKRDTFLQSKNFKVLRFNLTDLYFRQDYILKTVKENLEELINKRENKTLFNKKS